MTEPLVCAIMLTKDRPQMAKRAVECFRIQKYQNALLFVLDSGLTPPDLGLVVNQAPGSDIPCFRNEERTIVMASPGTNKRTIGQLRNAACDFPSAVMGTKPDIFIHWDDDDWSHPNRISEQVALLQASGKQCVGYRDMLFWRGPGLQGIGQPYYGYPVASGGLEYSNGEAWLYASTDPRYCLGTSLCYWREVWEKRPFKAISRGEDFEFQRELDRVGVTSITLGPTTGYEPRMIASIHSGNHVVYEPEKSAPPPAGNWKMVPEWDSYLRERMAL